ncbi:MAG: cation:proton antiporter, partial [Ilumatobacteraceae bacterium]
MHLQVQMLAATGSEAAIAFVEIGVIAVGLSFLALIAGRFGITAVPLYLIAGLAFGDGGIVDVTASSDFVSLTAEIGVLLLLLTLGLEYSADELRTGIRTGVLPGLLDMALNFTPGVALGLLLGWSTPASVLLGG